MTTGFFFRSNPVFENEPPESGAALTYSIGLSEIPEALQRCRTKTSYFMSQIGFDVISHGDVDSDPFNLEIAIHGDVNPDYNAALASLFGDEIGQILTQTGEVYEWAMRAHFEEVENEDGQGDEEVRYIGGLGIVEQLLHERQSAELAEQVLRRLMANSVFP